MATVLCKPLAYLGNIKREFEQGFLLKCVLVDLEVTLQRAMLHKLHNKADLWIMDHTFDLNNIWMLQSLNKIIRSCKSVTVQLLDTLFHTYQILV